MALSFHGELDPLTALVGALGFNLGKKASAGRGSAFDDGETHGWRCSWHVSGQEK